MTNIKARSDYRSDMPGPSESVSLLQLRAIMWHLQLEIDLCHRFKTTYVIGLKNDPSFKAGPQMFIRLCRIYNKHKEIWEPLHIIIN